MHSHYLDIANTSLTGYKPISLDEMDNVTLMDRTDMKFVLSFDALRGILQKLSDQYKVLTINYNNIFSYHTAYYDTPDLAMFSDHHNGKLNRYKIRHREYIESKLSFLEVKFKSNKGRVVKQRIVDKGEDHSSFIGFITSHTPYDPDILRRIIVNRFNRITLVDYNMRERVTIDFNLSFTDGIQHISLNGLVIIEVKQNKTDKESPVYLVLKEHAIRPSRISKYCIGISLLSDSTKINNFKHTLLKIKNMTHVELTA
ncbi:MAG TPA: polyphosphate polymerase domain-containing protein [Bacteroidales bacterium]|nr:polyphosphate polymerase domain-containing protein [Bacteroidales bacterium]